MRLTGVMRMSLANAVLQHRFSDEADKLIAERVKFASEVYDDIYRKADRERMAALPEGWLPTATCISAQFGEHSSGYENVVFGGGLHGISSRVRKAAKRPDPVVRRIFQKHVSGCAKQYPNDHRLSLRHQALKAAAKDLESRIQIAEKQAEAALNSVTTLPALLKAWPEIEPFTKRYLAAPVRLPAIPVSALNEMFKLPVGKASHALA